MRPIFRFKSTIIAEWRAPIELSMVGAEGMYGVDCRDLAFGLGRQQLGAICQTPVTALCMSAP